MSWAVRLLSVPSLARSQCWCSSHLHHLPPNAFNDECLACLWLAGCGIPCLYVLVSVSVSVSVCVCARFACRWCTCAFYEGVYLWLIMRECLPCLRLAGDLIQGIYAHLAAEKCTGMSGFAPYQRGGHQNESNSDIAYTVIFY